MHLQMKSDLEEIREILIDQKRVYAYGMGETGKNELQAVLNVNPTNDDTIGFSIRRARDAFLPMVKRGQIELRFIANGRMNLVDVILEIQDCEKIDVQEWLGCRTVQLREYMRIPARLTLRVFNQNSIRELKVVQGGNENISGSGLLFHITESLDTDSKLRMLVEANDGAQILINCRVVRCSQTSQQGVYTVAVRFENNNQETQDKILQFVLAALSENLDQFTLEEAILIG